MLLYLLDPYKNLARIGICAISLPWTGQLGVFAALGCFGLFCAAGLLAARSIAAGRVHPFR